jgi:hypothetical protein
LLPDGVDEDVAALGAPDAPVVFFGRTGSCTPGLIAEGLPVSST